MEELKEQLKSRNYRFKVSLKFKHSSILNPINAEGTNDTMEELNILKKLKKDMLCTIIEFSNNSDILYKKILKGSSKGNILKKTKLVTKLEKLTSALMMEIMFLNEKHIITNIDSIMKFHINNGCDLKNHYYRMYKFSINQTMKDEYNLLIDQLKEETLKDIIR